MEKLKQASNAARERDADVIQGLRVRVHVCVYGCSCQCVRGYACARVCVREREICGCVSVCSCSAALLLCCLCFAVVTRGTHTCALQNELADVTGKHTATSAQLATSAYPCSQFAHIPGVPCCEAPSSHQPFRPPRVAVFINVYDVSTCQCIVSVECSHIRSLPLREYWRIYSFLVQIVQVHRPRCSSYCIVRALL